MNARLFIDYKECELSKREVIALSYGVNRLTDIESRQGYYSNTFKLPKTATNLEIFGHPNSLTINDSKRWQRLTAWIEVDGVQVVYGFAQLSSVGADLEVVVKGGNSDWINLLKDKKLEDLNLRSLDHDHTQSNVQSNRFNTYADGFIYPDVDYGWLRDEEQNPHGRYFYPALFMKKAVDQMFTDTGYTLNNELDSDTRYQGMVMPFSNKEVLHSDEWETDKLFKVLFGTTATTTAGYVTVPFDSIDFDYGNHVDLGSNNYNAGDKINSSQFAISVTYTLGTHAPSSSIVIAISSTNVEFNGDPVTIILDTPATAGTFTVSTEFEWHDQGEDLYIKCLAINNMTFTIDGGSLECLSVDKKVLRGSEWNVAVNLPDLLQTDVLKYVANAFNALISANAATKVVTITPFDSVPLNSPEDWTEILDSSEDEMITFEYGDFKAENVLEYDINTDDTYLKDTPDLGKSTLTNSHKSEGIKKIYQAPFSLVARGITMNDTITKALIDLNEAKGIYSNIYYRPALTITHITNTGLVTVSSGAGQLFAGLGVYLYNVSDALYEGGFYPNTDFWVNERVFIISSVHSGTEFQLEGDFNGDPVSSADCAVGVMVDKFDITHVNVMSVGDASEGDEVLFYDTDGSTTIDGEPTNGSSALIDQIKSNRCITLKRRPTYTYDLEYIYPVISSPSSITTGNVRILNASDNKEAAPRVGIVTVSTDASNAITLYGESTETQVSEVAYDNITWDVLVAAYWTTLQQIIESPQMVKALVRLKASDIQSIDFTRPKYLSQFGCLFYLSYIDQFKTNQVDSTDVELVKLP